jgi:hypothetical protein
VTRTRSLLVSVLTLGALAASVASAQACTKTWTGGSGNWSEANHWIPSGAPESSESACIAGSSTYTVVVSTDAVAKTLTVGGGSGVQTIDVVGASQSYRGDTYNETTLGAETMSFAANTKLILEATGGGGAEPKGGGGVVQAETLTEAGQIETASSDPHMDNRLRVANLRIEPGAGLTDASGTLLFIQESEGAQNAALGNEGTVTVDPGAALELEHGFAKSSGFENKGAVVNDGSIDSHGDVWTQDGGSVTGNEVVLLGGSTLVDSAGSGTFLADNGGATVTGTIPAGQTVIVRGEPFNSGGENYYSTALSTGGKELVNDGTLVLNPTGSGETGGDVYLEAGSIHNNGVIDDETETAARVTQLNEGLTNGPAGRLEVNGGIFQGNNGAPFTNEGLVTIAPGAVYQLQEAAAFVNDGTLSPEIASTSSFGAVQLTGPCCSGPGKFTAGGTLAPVLLGGFVPVAGQEFDVFGLDGGKFEGTFPGVGNGFSADYSHEEASPAFVGVIYGASTAVTAIKGPPPPTPPPSAHVLSISGGHGSLTVALSCPAGGLACMTATVQATVTEHLKGGKLTAITARKGKKKAAAKTKTVVIATGSASLAPGATETLTLTLNGAGSALLAKYGKLTAIVTVSAAGKTLDTATVTVQKAKKPKKKK